MRFEIRSTEEYDPFTGKRILDEYERVESIETALNGRQIVDVRYFVEIGTLEDLLEMSRKHDCQVIVNAKESRVEVYNGYRE